MEPTDTKANTGTASKRKADNPGPSETSPGSYYSHYLYSS